MADKYEPLRVLLAEMAQFLHHVTDLYEADDDNVPAETAEAAAELVEKVEEHFATLPPRQKPHELN